MKFTYKQNTKIPSLAWLAIVKSDNRVEVLAGPSVYHSENFFVSGVWDVNCEDEDFAICNFSCCTGAKFFDDHIVFSTPHNTQ